MKPEEEIHRRTVAELRRFFLRERALDPAPLFHCPNESKVPVQYRTKLKALGLSSGVPDLIILHPTRAGAPGAALEIKAPRGRASSAQKFWLSLWDKAGFATAVTYGHEQTAAQLFRWGYITEHQVRDWARLH